MLLGKTTPRLWTPPLVTGPPGPCGCGCALTPETSKGFSALDFAEDPLGVRPFPFQRWLLIHALELRPDGRFRFRTVLVLVARQNGKTTFLKVKNLWKLYVLRVLLVIGTAQNLDMAEETWDEAVEIAEAIPDLAAEIAHVDRTNGKKALRLFADPEKLRGNGGPRWKITTASRKGGRTLAVDDVNLDELREHQTWQAWGAVTKTTMARPHAQTFAYSNAGDDLSVVLNHLREVALATVDDPMVDPSLGIFEWSAPDDVKCTCLRRPGSPHAVDCRLRDPDAWAQANPALGYGTLTLEALESALNTDPEAVFRTECLCQRVPSLVPEWQVIGQVEWEARKAPTSQLDGPPAFGVYVPPDRSWAAIAAAGESSLGGRHVEITGDGVGLLDYRPGAGWVVPRLQELEAHGPSVVVVDDKATADAAEVAGIVVHRATVSDVVTGCQLLYDGIADPDEAKRDVWHIGQGVFTDAVRGAVRRDVGGSWAWARRDLQAETTPVAAGSLALFGHVTPRVHRPVLVFNPGAFVL